jgi:beta-1,2-mannosidase
VYRPSTRTYYLLYSAVQQYPNNVTSRLALATSPDGVHWTRHGPLFPQIAWSKSGAMLIRDEDELGARAANIDTRSNSSNASTAPGKPSLLFWGDSTLVGGLEVAVAVDRSLLRWKNIPEVWLPVRADHFDSQLVEAGPEPLRLRDGNYLMLYNSARCCLNSSKPGYQYQYNAGFVILDGSNPTRILQRSALPLLSPETAWEIGESPQQLGLTPNVVFIEGWQRYEGEQHANGDLEQFIVYYGAADSVVGVALISVSVSGQAEQAS